MTAHKTRDGLTVNIIVKNDAPQLLVFVIKFCVSRAFNCRKQNILKSQPSIQIVVEDGIIKCKRHEITIADSACA